MLQGLHQGGKTVGGIHHDNNCHFFASCFDETPFYKCICNSGYRGDGVECIETELAVFTFQMYEFGATPGFITLNG